MSTTNGEVPFRQAAAMTGTPAMLAVGDGLDGPARSVLSNHVEAGNDHVVEPGCLKVVVASWTGHEGTGPAAECVHGVTQLVSPGGEFVSLVGLPFEDAGVGEASEPVGEEVGWLFRGDRLGTDVRSVVVENDHAAVLYDLVTDTPVGPVLCSGFLTIDIDRIRASILVFDWRHWTQVLEELRSRASTATPVEATPAVYAEMRGRTMNGWLRLAASDVDKDEELARWIDRALSYTSTLPRKQ